MHNDSAREAEREVRRLTQLAEHFQQKGDHARATELRFEALMLTAAELQRMHAINEAHRESNLLHDRMHAIWETVSPTDSYWWFYKNSLDPEAVEIRQHIERQQARLEILEAAKP